MVKRRTEKMAVTIKYDKSWSKIFGGTPYFFYKQADGRVNGRNIVNRLRSLGFSARMTVNQGKNTGGWPVKIYNIWLREK